MRHQLKHFDRVTKVPHGLVSGDAWKMINALGAFGMRRFYLSSSERSFDEFVLWGKETRRLARISKRKIRRSAPSTVGRFLSDRSGAAMVEFAMTGAMLLLSIMWLLEVGLTYMTTLEMEAATKDIARVVRTRRTGNLPVPEVVKTEAEIEADKKLTPAEKAAQKLAGQLKLRFCDRVVFAVGCKEKLTLIVRSAENFGNLSEPSSVGLGKPNFYVIVTAELTSPLTVFGKDRIVRAAAVTQNEP